MFRIMFNVFFFACGILAVESTNRVHISFFSITIAMMDSSQMSVENMAQEEEKNVISELSWDTRHNLEKKAAYKMRISSLGYRNDALTGGIITK